MSTHLTNSKWPNCQIFREIDPRENIKIDPGFWLINQKKDQQDGLNNAESIFLVGQLNKKIRLTKWVLVGNYQASGEIESTHI